MSHPEVRVDPGLPVPDWGLSEAGRARVAALVAQPWVPGLVAVFSSAERKAVETAQPLAAAAGLVARVDPDLGENDRSATGFLPPEEFEATADAFFARPDESVRGWETARAAQARVVGAVRRCLALAAPGDVVVVTHGGVGTLLLCALRGVPVSREHDQPGQGSAYAVDRGTLRPLSGWQRLPTR